MAMVVNVQEAKTRLSELLVRVEAGEEIVIARAGKPVAYLRPVGAVPPRTFGTFSVSITPAFFEPLAEEELTAWQ